jgi:hypothetical protein
MRRVFRGWVKSIYGFNFEGLYVAYTGSGNNRLGNFLFKKMIVNSCLFCSAMVFANGVAAQTWVINPSAINKASSNNGQSTATQPTLKDSATSVEQSLQPRAVDSGVLSVNNDGTSSYRSSGYKNTAVVSEAPAFSSESFYGPTDIDSNALEDLEASRPVGRGEIYPIANVSLGYRGDVYESDETGSVEPRGAATLGWRVGGGYQGSNRGHLNGIEYLMEGNEFLSGDNDENEVSQRINAYWGTAFTPRHHLDLGVEYVDAYDPRGLGDSQRNIRFNVAGENPDRWNELTGGGVYSFGRDTARGRLELGAHLTNREYDNNDQQFRNRDELDISAAAFLRVMAKTEFYAQVVYTDFDYVDQTAAAPTNGRDLDNQETRYMLGLKWYPSQDLSGSVRVGTTEKTFGDQSQRQDYDELTWNSNLVWTPNTRDGFAVSYSRSLEEPFVYTAAQLIDDVIEVENLAFSWSHMWGQRLSTTLGYTFGDDRFFPSGRIDDRDEFTIGVSYKLPRLGTVGVTYFNRKRDSNVAEQSYDDDGFSVFFNLGAALGLGDGNSRAPGVRNQRQFQPGYAVY